MVNHLGWVGRSVTNHSRNVPKQQEHSLTTLRCYELFFPIAFINLYFLMLLSAVFFIPLSMFTAQIVLQSSALPHERSFCLHIHGLATCSISASPTGSQRVNTRSEQLPRSPRPWPYHAGLYSLSNQNILHILEQDRGSS